MDREVNLDFILALEKQLEERDGHEKTQLKPTRKFLLNVSIFLPPEILGSIFCWNVIPDGDFGELPDRSYNFLLVCRHWFEVALSTPELWNFCGNSIKDLAHRHARYGTVPLDLVLGTSTSDELDDQLRGALQDRITRNMIRRVHLRGTESKPLKSVVSSIITEGEGTQLNRVSHS